MHLRIKIKHLHVCHKYYESDSLKFYTTIFYIHCSGESPSKNTPLDESLFNVPKLNETILYGAYKKVRNTDRSV